METNKLLVLAYLNYKKVGQIQLFSYIPPIFLFSDIRDTLKYAGIYYHNSPSEYRLTSPGSDIVLLPLH